MSIYIKIENLNYYNIQIIDFYLDVNVDIATSLCLDEEFLQKIKQYIN